MPKGLVGKLSVGLSLSAGAFTKGLDNARMRMNKFSKGTQAVKRSMLALGASLAVGGALATRAIKQSLADMDNLAKTSNKLGVTADALASIRFAGEIAGIEIAQLDKALQRMVVNASEAAAQTGEAREAMERLKLDPGKLLSVSADKQMLLIADALTKVNDENERLFLITELFGRRGGDIKNLLEDPKLLRSLIQEFKGFNFDLSGQGLKKIEDANDAMLRLRTAWRSFSASIAQEVAPLLSKITGLVTDFNKWRNKRQGNLQAGTSNLQDSSSSFNMSQSNDWFVNSLSAQTLGALPGMEGRLPLQALRGLAVDSTVTTLLERIASNTATAGRQQ